MLSRHGVTRLSSNNPRVHELQFTDGSRHFITDNATFFVAHLQGPTTI